MRFDDAFSSPCMIASKASNENNSWIITQTNLSCRRWFEYGDELHSMDGKSVESLVKWTGISSNVEILSASREKKHGFCCLAMMNIPEPVMILQFRIFIKKEQQSATCDSFTPEEFLLQHSKDALVYFGFDGTILSANEKAKAMIARDVAGLSVSAVFEPEVSTSDDVLVPLEQQFANIVQPGTLFSVNCHFKAATSATTDTQDPMPSSVILWCRKTLSGVSARICFKKKTKRKLHRKPSVNKSSSGSEHASGGSSAHSSMGEEIDENRDERREIRKAELTKHAQNEMAFMSCSDSILILDQDSALCIRSNPSANKLFGYSDSEFRHVTGRILSDPADPDNKARHETMKSNGHYNGRMLLRKKSGESFWAMGSITVFEALGKAYAISVVRDITDVVNREKELEDRYISLKNSMSELAHGDRMNSIGLLSAGVAHEINNPVAILQGNITCLLDDNTMAKRSVKLLNECNDCVNRISGVVSVLASFSQTNQAIQYVNINEIVENVEVLTRSEFRGKTSLILSLHPNLPPICGDRGKLSQVLVNLLMNSVKAIQLCENSKPEHFVKIETSIEESPYRVTITISDSGSGIPVNLQPILFKPFVTTRIMGEGIGMGLTICRGIVEQHNGNIELLETGPQGTSFRVHLPINNSLTPPQPVAPIPTICSPRMLRSPVTNFNQTLEDTLSQRPEKPKLLVVDDEVLLLKVHRRNLSPFFDVHTANGGDEALEMLLQSNFNFDVVICDLMMPVDAKVIYDTLQEKKPEILSKFVFCTAGAVTIRLQEFVENVKTLHPFVKKPATREMLMTACNSVLELREIPI